MQQLHKFKHQQQQKRQESQLHDPQRPQLRLQQLRLELQPRQPQNQQEQFQQQPQNQQEQFQQQLPRREQGTMIDE